MASPAVDLLGKMASMLMGFAGLIAVSTIIALLAAKRWGGKSRNKRQAIYTVVGVIGIIVAGLFTHIGRATWDSGDRATKRALQRARRVRLSTIRAYVRSLPRGREAVREKLRLKCGPPSAKHSATSSWSNARGRSARRSRTPRNGYCSPSAGSIWARHSRWARCGYELPEGCCFAGRP